MYGTDLTGILVVIIAALIVIYAISRCIRMVEQTDAWIIEFLGTYRSTWKAGLHLKLPFVEKVAAKVSLKENVVDFEPQTVITRDNVTVKIDTVVFFQVTDAKRFLTKAGSSVETSYLSDVIRAMEGTVKWRMENDRITVFDN